MKAVKNLAASLAATSVAALALVSSGFGAASSGAVLDQHATGVPTKSELVSYLDAAMAAQTFTAGVTGHLTEVVVQLSLGPTPADYDAGITVTLTPVVGGVPDTSTVLAKGKIASGVVTTTMAKVGVAFASPAFVTAGQEYAIVLEEVAAGQWQSWYSHYWLGRFPSSTYAGGTVATSSGSSWTAGGTDAWFETYVVPAVSHGHEHDESPRAGYCIGGRFFDLVLNQPDADPLYKGARTATFLEGIGITCDPVPAGWVAKGWTLDGTPDASGRYRLFGRA